MSSLLQEWVFCCRKNTRLYYVQCSKLLHYISLSNCLYVLVFVYCFCRMFELLDKLSYVQQYNLQPHTPCLLCAEGGSVSEALVTRYSPALQPGRRMSRAAAAAG